MLVGLIAPAVRQVGLALHGFPDARAEACGPDSSTWSATVRRIDFCTAR